MDIQFSSVPESNRWTMFRAASVRANTVFVVDAASVKQDFACYIHADTVKQKGMVFFRKEDEK